jgi:hypothetical protein
MVNNTLTLIKRQCIISVVVILALGLTTSASCQSGGIALLLEQTPAQGGSITPATGIHLFDTDTDVTLKAVPKPGYQFAYWLGDVSDPTSNNTVVYLDAPKIIIAVFERSEFDFVDEIERQTDSLGFGGFAGPAGDYSRVGGGGAIRRRGFGIIRRRPPKRPDLGPPVPDDTFEPEGDFPAPEGPQGDFPVPQIPEPATAVLLSLGSLLAFTRNRDKRQNLKNSTEE